MTQFTLRRIFSSAAFALAMAAVIVGLQLAAKPDRPIYADELQYLTVSQNIARHGVFSDRPASDNSAPAPTAFFTPVAPFLYALLIKADARLAESIACQLAAPNGASQGKCPVAYGPLMRLVMGSLAALGVWGSWLLARSLGLGTLAAWVSMTVVAASGSHALFARHFLTETPLLAVFPFFLLLLARATEPSHARQGEWLALGVIMGLLALIRPSYTYQAYLVILLLPLLRRYRGETSSAILPLAYAALGYAVTILPWMIRNLLAVDQFVLTAGYDGNILAQRMIYNQMSWAEWGMAWIYWLPDFGDNVAASLFGEDAVRKLSLVEPSGYHGAGNPPVPPEFIRQPDGSPATLGYLLGIIVADPVKHLLVTLVMAWQGLWAGKYITFVALLLSPVALILLSRDGKLRAFLVVALPVLFMVGFNAFVSVSIPRYNLPMLWISALIAATLADAFARRLAQRSPRP